MTPAEANRTSRFLKNHFVDNLKLRFTYQGQELDGLFVFHPSALLGIACHIVDTNGINKDGNIVQDIVPTGEGFFQCRFDLAGINGFKLVQIVQTLELLFDIPLAADVPNEPRDFELFDLVEALLANYIDSVKEGVAQ